LPFPTSQLGYPDIGLSGITLTYDHTNGAFVAEGTASMVTLDGQMNMAPGAQGTFHIDATIVDTPDHSGHATSGNLLITFGGETWFQSDTLLGFGSGSVRAFEFVFEQTPITGPPPASPLAPPTGTVIGVALANGTGVTGLKPSFGADFRVTGATGDAAPIPAPNPALAGGALLASVAAGSLIRFRRGRTLGD